MQIQKVTRYAVDGKEFPSVAKAQDYLDSEVNKLLQTKLTDNALNMLSMTDIVRITEVVLNNRHRLVELLSASYGDDED